jgi:hypothetical protein
VADPLDEAAPLSSASNSAPLRERVRSLAQLGGFFARTRDGEPGMHAIWQGDQRLPACIYAIDTYRTINALERNV